ncbi:MAG: PAS domain-containing protein, partial [Desulfobacterales bacterium]|nr:PAS domain-containing protein [Desulfobacterales bacterium]
MLIASNMFLKKAPKTSPIAEKGVLDLRNWDFEKDGIIDLKGEWEFYWERFLYVEDFLNSNAISFNKEYIKVPGTWRGFKINDKKISGEGFATYRLKVILDKPYHMMSLKLDVIFSAFSMYINGNKITSAGAVGKTPETSIPFPKPHIVDFGCFQKEFEIIIHVSNFHYKESGLLWKIQFGLPESIHHLQVINIASDLFIFGSIFILGLYHLCFFIIYRKEKSFISFGLLCLLISLRTLIVGEFYLREIFPYISWNVLIKLIHWLSFFPFMFLTLFIHSLFPNEFSKKVLNFTLSVCILFSILILIPIKTIQFNLMLIFSVLALLLISYIVFIIVLALKHNREGSIMTFIGFSIFFLTIINDILHDNNIINTKFCAHYGLIALIFSYALILAFRFFNSYKIIERYSFELKKEIIERRKIEEQFKELLSTIEDVVWSSKTDGSEYYYMSPNIEKVYGISLSEFKNNPMLWLNAIHPDDRDEIEKISSKIFEEEKIFKEYRIIRNNGEIRWLEDRKYVIYDEHKKAVRIGGIARDITERKKLEEELKEKQAQLMQSSKMASLGEIATGLAHEINQPLTYISGLIQ